MKPRPRRYRWLEGILLWNSYSVAQGAPRLPDSAIVIASYLSAFPMKADGSGIRVGLQTIADDLGMPYRTAQDSMRRLRQAGVLVQIKGHNRRSATEYQAILTPVMYGYGADELLSSDDLVHTADRAYETVDNFSYTRPTVHTTDLVDTGSDLVGTDRRSRRHGSPSREQMNRKNRAQSRPSGPVDTDAPAPAWTNDRADGLTPLADVVAQVRRPSNNDRYGLDDPHRPPGTPDWEVHDDCGWTFGSLKHITECVEARTA